MKKLILFALAATIVAGCSSTTRLHEHYTAREMGAPTTKKNHI